MNLKFYIICVVAVLTLVGPALANSTATVHGGVYGWDTFEPLENSVVEVNSTPSQSIVAKYGLYSFELVPGDYTITARYYQNSTLVYSAEETIIIKNEGKYVVDLLLLPVYSEALMDGSEVSEFSENPKETTENSSSDTTNSPVDAAAGQTTSYGKNNSSGISTTYQNGTGSISANYLLVLLLLFLLFGAGYGLYRKNSNTKKNRLQKREHLTGKKQTRRGLSDPFKGPETPAEVQDENVEVRVKVSHNYIEPELKQESQAPGFRVEPSETVSAIESADSIKESVSEPLEGSLEDPIKEPVRKPVNEQVKMPVKALTPEIPEEKLQAEQAEIEEVPQANGRELVEPKPQKEKQEMISEEIEDQPLKSPEIEARVSRKRLPLPADLQEVMGIIRGQGGRITQKDLRSKLKYSEGKVSLMLADLERRDLIEKFKRGRGNVVILKDEER